MDEVPLKGGRTTNEVVRLEDTVRRTRSANSDFVCRLLKHLELVKFQSAPRYLGVDARGRDILTYLPGEVPSDLDYWEPEVLEAAALLIRDFHDASSRSELTAGWEVVCHNDLSPCNTVFVEGRPTALIDFDAAAPGNRSRDLGYAAWLWLDLGRPDISGLEQAQRLSLFLNSYGYEDRSSVLLSMKKRQLEIEQGCTRENLESAAEWARKCRFWLESHWRELKNAADA